MLSKARLQALLETGGQFFIKNLNRDAPCLRQVGSGSWKEKWGQKVAFMRHRAVEQCQVTSSYTELGQLPWATRGHHCQGAMVGNTVEKRLQEMFHGGAVTPGARNASWQ